MNMNGASAALAVAFDKMAERLEKVFGAQKQLLRDASHELRSPLARLQVALGLARQRAHGARKSWTVSSVKPTA